MAIFLCKRITNGRRVGKAFPLDLSHRECIQLGDKFQIEGHGTFAIVALPLHNTPPGE